MASEDIRVVLTPLDHLHPTNYVKLFFYFPLRSDANFADVFNDLHEALHRTFVQLPWLNGKVHRQEPAVSGWKPGQREIRYRAIDIDGPRPYQLRFKDLRSELSYADLKEDGFPNDAFSHEDLLSTPVLGDIDAGADLFISQANFITGACLLALSTCHAALDGSGMITIMKVWAKNYRSLHGEESGAGVEEQPPPESWDRALLDRLWVRESKAPPSTEADAWTRGLVGLGFEPLKEEIIIPPLRTMQERMFYLSRSSMVALQKECETETGAGILSSGDVITALLWRCILRARKSVDEDISHDVSVLEMPVDARAGFSEAIPPAYMGNCCFFNHATLSLSDLVDPSTPLGRIAQVIRSAASRVTTAAMHHAYAVMRDVSDNNLLFPIDEICFGNHGFANGGRAEVLRISMGPYNNFVRVAFIMPRRSHGGVELNISLFDNEMESLLEDEEFGRFCLPL